jgi:putative flippase GtrA
VEKPTLPTEVSKNAHGPARFARPALIAGVPSKGLIRLVTRYGLVGGLGAAFSLVSYYWLVGSFRETLGYVWPSVMISVVWFPIAFALHRRFVFGNPGKPFRAFVKFVSAQWMLFSLGPIFLVLLVEFMGLEPFLAYVLVLIVLSLVSFAVSRWLVFRASESGVG